MLSAARTFPSLTRLAHLLPLVYIPCVLHLLKRHPFSVEAMLQRSLVLTYAVPRAQLEPLLGPGLELDTFGDWGFVAVAMVTTQQLRPLGMPRWCGSDFFLCGYRIFTRFTSPGRPTIRGLRILRSDTDRRRMVALGSVFTHYNYSHAVVRELYDESRLELRVETPNAEADVHVVADLSSSPAPLPSTSVFSNLAEARRFAGPLPYTFDYEAETNRMVVIKGVRKAWAPTPVSVTLHRATFLDKPAFANARLSNAFFLRDIPYTWRPGQLRELA